MHNRSRNRVATRGKRTLRRAGGYCAFLALLALVLQIVAVALCPCGPANALAGAPAQSAMPPCHGEPGSADHEHGGAPNRDKPANCPFCSAHCHAPLVFAPALSGVEPLFAIATTAGPAHFVFFFEPARFASGASPRGPPASI
jgi:hypothetical protein